MPRSGTTLVEQILASHPEVFGVGELGEFPRLMAQLTGTGKHGRLARAIPFPNRAVAKDVQSRYLRLLTDRVKGASRVVNKTLENAFYLGLLATLFPNARFILCRRDARDVCLSCYFNNFQNMDWSWSLEDIVAYYREYERVMNHWKKVLPLPIHEITYEDLIANQERVTRELLQFCGLDWNEHCLTFYDTCRTVQTASAIQVRSPLSAKSIGRWISYRAHLGPLLTALAEPTAGVPALNPVSAAARCD
jgi:hypothetical protein